MKYPISKYRYYFTNTKDGGRKVIAISTYAGKTVRGVAICHPGDTYDEGLGKKIAAARCAVKIAQKRVDRALMKREEADKMLEQTRNHVKKMETYYSDAIVEREDALSDLAELMGTVSGDI